MKIKPNRRRYQTFRAILTKSNYSKREESLMQQKQRGICSNCNEPICKRGWCDKIGNIEHKKRD